MTVFRAYVNGYTFSTTNLNIMQMWIDQRKVDCKGHELKLWKGTRHGSADVYNSCIPGRIAVL